MKAPKDIVTCGLPHRGGQRPALFQVRLQCINGGRHPLLGHPFNVFVAAPSIETAEGVAFARVAHMLGSPLFKTLEWKVLEVAPHEVGS